MIEKTYSKHIAHHGDEQMRRAVFDVDALPLATWSRWCDSASGPGRSSATDAD